MASADDRLIADVTELVLDRLEAWQAGDQGRVAEVDARAPKDGPGLTALWSAAFGIAERTLNVVAARDPAEAERLLRSYREQVEDYRRR